MPNVLSVAAIISEFVLELSSSPHVVDPLTLELPHLSSAEGPLVFTSKNKV